jgi:hypothetical protein
MGNGPLWKDGSLWVIMANPSVQRKNPFAQTKTVPLAHAEQSLLQLQLLMAGSTADLMQTDLLLTLGTPLITRLTIGLGARSRLHDPLLPENRHSERRFAMPDTPSGIDGAASRGNAA